MKTYLLRALSVIASIGAVNLVSAQNLNVAGDLSATGALDINGNTASFGAHGANPGYSLIYTDGTAAIIDFSASATGSNWIWSQGAGPQLKLSANNILSLYTAGGATGVALNPSGASTFSGNVGIGTTIPAASPLVIQFPVGGSTNPLNSLSIESRGSTGVTGTVDLAIRVPYAYGDGVNRNATDPNLDLIKVKAGNTVLATDNVTGAALGNVGIGTLAPSERLEVAGNLKVNGLISSGGNFNPGGSINVTTGQTLTFLNAGNSAYISSPGSDRLRLGVASGVAVEARSTGLMFPAGNRIMDQNSKTLLTFGYIDSAVNYVELDNAVSGQGPVIRTAGTDGDVNLNIDPKGNGHLLLSAPARLGIGTDSPNSKLHILGRTNNGHVLLGGVNDAGYMTFARGSDGSVQGGIGYINATTGGELSIVSNGGSGFMHFDTGGAERMRISTLGNVGIGITDPAAKLDVSGNVRISTRGYLGHLPSTQTALTVFDNQSLITVEQDGNLGPGSVGIQFIPAGSGAASGQYRLFGSPTAGPYGSGLVFEQGGTAIGGGVLRVKLDGAGNLGIGTSAPTEKLDVVGNAKISGSLVVNGAPVATTTAVQTWSARQSHSVGVTITDDSAAGGLTLGGGSSDGANLRLVSAAGQPQWNIDNSGGALRFFTETSPGSGAVTAATFSNKILRFNDGQIQLAGSGAYTAQFEMVGGGDQILQIRGAERISLCPQGVIYPPHGKFNFTEIGMSINTSNDAASNIAMATSAIQFEPSVNSAGGIKFGWDVNLYRSAIGVLRTDQALSAASLTVDGNVGVGTATPTAKLDVAGDAKFSGATTLQGPVTINDVVTINRRVAKLRIEPQGDLSMGIFKAGEDIP